jgi:hypothetical protein
VFACVYVRLCACMCVCVRVWYIGVEAEMGGDGEGTFSRAATCISPLPPAPTPRAVELAPADGASRACYLAIIDGLEHLLEHSLSLMRAA